MFIKARLKVWIPLVLICLLVTHAKGILNGVGSFFKGLSATEYTIAFDTKDALIGGRIDGKKIKSELTKNKYIMSVVTHDANIIITDKEDTSYEGYTKYEKYLYTPIALFCNTTAELESQDLKIVREDGRNKFAKDIRVFLSAIESDKVWNDIGITSRKLVNPKDPVYLIVPDVYDGNYIMTREFIISALNDFKEIDEFERNEFESRADAILAKCHKRDITSYIKKGFEGFVLYPEQLVSEIHDYDFVTEISPMNTLKLGYSVYVKAGMEDESLSILKNGDFLNYSGLRNKEISNLSGQSRYTNAVQNINGDFVFIKSEYKTPNQLMADLEKLPTTEVAVENLSNEEVVESKTFETKETVEEIVISKKESDAESEQEEFNKNEKVEAEENIKENNEEDKGSHFRLILTFFLLFWLIYIFIFLSVNMYN